MVAELYVFEINILYISILLPSILTPQRSLMGSQLPRASPLNKVFIPIPTGILHIPE